jgi:hypothetical protein
MKYGELESLRLETIAKISQLNAEAATQLEQYRVNWQNELTAVNADADKQLSALQTEWATKLGVLTDNAEKEFKDMQTKVQTTVQTMRADTEKEFTTLATNIQTIMRTPDWASVGRNIIDGMTQGVISAAGRLAEAAAEAAYSALQSAEAALGINSPSKEFEKLGMYSDLGFANGLSGFTSVIIASANGVGKTAINTLQGAISKISNIMESGINTAPVIRPVLDLSDIEAGGQRINDLFAQRKGINVAAITKNIPVVGKTNTDVSTPAQIAQPQQGPSISFTQNNYSPKALSRIDIYRQTKNQISTLKGVVKPV